MSATPEPLDPDEVTCPKATCQSAPGIPCRRPNGRRAERIHPERRTLAAAGGIEPDRAVTEPASGKRAGQAPPPASKASRSKGGKVAQQNRERRRREIEAQAEELRVEEERRAAAENAQQIADDAIRYTRDRALVKRQTLDAASKANGRLIEALDHLHRPAGYDDEGRPRTKPVEVYTTERGIRKRVVEADGTPAVKEVADEIGYFSVQQVESLAKAAASALNSLRLEEGKATGITGQDPAASDALSEATVEQLLEWAQRDSGGRAE